MPVCVLALVTEGACTHATVTYGVTADVHPLIAYIDKLVLLTLLTHWCCLHGAVRFQLAVAGALATLHLDFTMLFFHGLQFSE